MVEDAWRYRLGCWMAAFAPTLHKRAHHRSQIQIDPTAYAIRVTSREYSFGFFAMTSANAKRRSV